MPQDTFQLPLFHRDLGPLDGVLVKIATLDPTAELGAAHSAVDQTDFHRGILAKYFSGKRGARSDTRPVRRQWLLGHHPTVGTVKTADVCIRRLLIKPARITPQHVRLADHEVELEFFLGSRLEQWHRLLRLRGCLCRSGCRAGPGTRAIDFEQDQSRVEWSLDACGRVGERQHLVVEHAGSFCFFHGKDVARFLRRGELRLEAGHITLAHSD